MVSVGVVAADVASRLCEPRYLSTLDSRRRAQGGVMGLAARKKAQQAFHDAITQGRLSLNPRDPTYAGHYMYMGPDTNGNDTFKHITTRMYLRKGDTDAS